MTELTFQLLKRRPKGEKPSISLKDKVTMKTYKARHKYNWTTIILTQSLNATAKSWTPEQCYPVSFILLEGEIWAEEEFSWSVFCATWPSLLSTLNLCFVVPQESKSMGNELLRLAHETGCSTAWEVALQYKGGRLILHNNRFMTIYYFAYLCEWCMHKHWGNQSQDKQSVLSLITPVYY